MVFIAEVQENIEEKNQNESIAQNELTENKPGINRKRMI